MEIKNSKELREKLLEYDVLFFDVYGVVFDGKNKFKGTNEMLEFLKEHNKTVFFLSNSPEDSKRTKEKFIKIEIFENKHYDDFITSGTVFKNFLLSGKNKNEINFSLLKNYYIFGKVEFPEDYLDFNLAKNISEADFVFVGYPVFTEEEYTNFTDEEKKHLSKSSTIKDCYVCDDINLYVKKINEIKKYNLPIVSNCADMFVQAPVEESGEEIKYVLGQGSIIETYKNLGGKVLNVAKPSSLMYDFSLNLLKSKFFYTDEKIKKSKFLMIGDTINTDILGAKNARQDLNIYIDGLLTMCGVSGMEFQEDKNEIRRYCSKHDIALKYIIDDVGVII